MARRLITRRRLRQLVVALIALATAATGVMALPDKPVVVQPGVVQEGLTVVKVQDGDTFVVDINGQEETVRMLGLDTPETKDPRKPVQCFGLEASNWTKQRLAGRRVRLESDPSQGERDRYNRLLMYVWRDDGLFINQTLIADGFAHEYTYQSKPYKYQSDFQQAEQQARTESRGLWSVAACNGDTTQPAKSPS